MQTSIVFKGRREGLELNVSGYQDFDSFVELVETKLKAMGDFLQHSKVNMQVFISGEHNIDKEQAQTLTQLFSEYYLVYVEKDFVIKQKKKVQQEPVETKNYTKQLNFGLPDDQVVEKEACLIVYKTLRSGQFVSYHMGSIIVIGDVNPGAKVSAAGDIIISGWTRGELHAGALGDEKSSITAKKFKSGQLRIASLIAVADDADVSTTKGIERAVVENGNIVIDNI